MSLGHGASTVKEGLVLHLDAANAKSYPGKTGPELVTNEVITQEDGNTFNVFRDANTNTNLPLCSVVSGKYYIVKYVISSYTGGVGATFRINGSGANLTPITAISSAGTFTKTFQANVSGSLSINGDNTGTDFEVDFVSVKEMISNTGTTWKDLSGNGNDTNLINNVEYSESNFIFDGSNDYVQVGTNPEYSAISSITIETVFNRTSVGSQFYQVIASNTRDCCGVYDGFQMHISNSTADPATLVCNLWNSDNYNGVDWTTSYTSKSFGAIIETNKWYYVAITYDLSSSLYKGYINGNLVSTQTKANALSNNQASFELQIGKSPSHNANFTGYIPKTRIYNRALTETEIKQNFEALRGRYGI